MDKYYYGEHEPDPDIRFKQAFKANREHLVSTIQPNVAYPDQTFKVLIPRTLESGCDYSRYAYVKF